MVRLSSQIRLVLTFLVAVSLSGTITACSKDNKKGTPITERKSGAAGGGSGNAGETGLGGKAGERGFDAAQATKATPAQPSDLHRRGADSAGAGVQIDKNGVPAEALKELRAHSGDDTEIRTTPVSQIGVSSSQGTSGSTNWSEYALSGEYLGSDYTRLTPVRPDYSEIYERANNRPYEPIATLGTNPADPDKGLVGGEFDFTDYTDDLAMNTVLRLSMKTNDLSLYSDLHAGHNNDLPQAFFDDSKEFAGDIRDIRARVTAEVNSKGQGYTNASIKITYVYNGTNRVLNLQGLVGQQSRRAVLKQRSEDGGLKFQGYLTCLDLRGFSNGCQNSILVVEEVKGGKICKRVFAVIRHLNVAMTIDREDYRSYYDQTNPQKKKFLQYLANTVLVNRYEDGLYVPEDGDDILLFGAGRKDDRGRSLPTILVPYIKKMTSRTFAIAHAYAESELLIQESGYDKLQSDEVSDASQLVPRKRRDVLRLVGPLARPTEGNNYSSVLEHDGYILDEYGEDVQPYSQEKLMADLISTAEVVGNDGRGTVEVKYNFGSDSLMVVYMARNVEIMDPRTLALYPYQGKPAPEDVTPDRMPIPFSQ